MSFKLKEKPSHTWKSLHIETSCLRLDGEKFLMVSHKATHIGMKPIFGLELWDFVGAGCAKANLNIKNLENSKKTQNLRKLEFLNSLSFSEFSNVWLNHRDVMSHQCD